MIWDINVFGVRMKFRVMRNCYGSLDIVEVVGKSILSSWNNEGAIRLVWQHALLIYIWLQLLRVQLMLAFLSFRQQHLLLLWWHIHLWIFYLILLPSWYCKIYLNKLWTCAYGWGSLRSSTPAARIQGLPGALPLDPWLHPNISLGCT